MYIRLSGLNCYKETAETKGWAFHRQNWFDGFKFEISGSRNSVFRIASLNEWMHLWCGPYCEARKQVQHFNMATTTFYLSTVGSSITQTPPLGSIKNI